MILPRKPDSTIANAITQANAYLAKHDLVYGHGTASSEDDAAWLILEAAGLSPLEQPDYGLVLADSVVDKAETFLRMRAEQRLPAAYIVGRMWFAGLEFKADSRALIPRSPLAEFLTEDALGLIDTAEVSTVLDLCTGGGCIAIACAYAFPGARVDAVDLSSDALALAEENVKMHDLEDRIQLIQGDLFDSVAARYDLIISNPPYVDAQAISDMGHEFSHEPMMGLAAGNDGLDLAHKIISGSARYLQPGGALVCEVGDSAAALCANYPDLPFQWLDFSMGGDGVFLLYRQDLADAGYDK